MRTRRFIYKSIQVAAVAYVAVYVYKRRNGLA
jgi:hypothetical protein